MVTEELLEWEADVKMALEDPDVYQRIREINVRYTVVSFLTQLVKEQWGLLGSSTLESVAQRRFLKRKAENNVESNRPNDVYESTERLESDTIDDANERRGSGEGETGNGDNMDVEGVGCLENDGIDKVIEQHGAEEERTMGAQEQEHESSLDKGYKTAARELKEYLLEI